MSESTPTFVVSAFETQENGKRRWKTLLVTKDEAKAKALKDAIEADDVRCEIEIIRPPRKKR